MNYFDYNRERLYCEEVSVSDIAKEVGTPFFLYSHKTLLQHFNAFNNAFEEIDHLVCYAIKANSNIAILNLFAKEGSGFDAVSGGEIFRAITAGCDPEKIVYAGVGKTREEIRYALEQGILMFNVESSQELFVIDEISGSMGLKADVALRVNPDIDAKTHPYITTGMKSNKFGINIDLAFNEYKLASSFKNINLVGIHQHIGSQITQISPFVDALKRLLALADRLKAEGIPISSLDLGGGLGINYEDEAPPHPAELAKELVPILKNSGYKIIFEPGRVIVGNAGVLISKILYTKIGEEKNFLIVDAGMNDLVRPSLYESYHEIIPVRKAAEAKEEVVDVVGPICESGDFLAKDRSLPKMKKDDLMAVMSAGAYGFTMSSNYNSRRKAAEILVKGDRYFVIRERERHEDLIRGERVIEL